MLVTEEEGVTPTLLRCHNVEAETDANAVRQFINTKSSKEIQNDRQVQGQSRQKGQAINKPEDKGELQYNNQDMSKVKKIKQNRTAKINNSLISQSKYN